MSKDKLSKRQEAIYAFICDYTRERGFPPSVREIGTAVGLASPSTVHMHLKVLQERGLIRRDSKKPRTIEVVSERPERAKGEEKLATVSIDVDSNLISLPVVGRVAAGVPILAEQNIEEHLTLPTSIVGDTSSFVLRVRGQSMINAGIYDGDYVVVKEQKDAHDGEIVVAMIDESCTVKTFYREKDQIRRNRLARAGHGRELRGAARLRVLRREHPPVLLPPLPALPLPHPHGCLDRAG